MKLVNVLLWITLGTGILTLVVLGALPFTWRLKAMYLVGICFLANIMITTIGILLNLQQNGENRDAV